MAALVILLTLGTVTAKHRIDLERREQSHVNVTDVMLDIRHRQRMRSNASSLWSWLPMGAPPMALMEDKAKFVKEDMINFMNLQYLGRVYIGEPSQSLNLVFDTGSSDLWVWSERFNYEISATWMATDFKVTIHYGTGIASGYYALDRVCLDATPPLCIYRQPLFLATTLVGIDMQEMDGLVGMGFIGLSHIHRTFLRNLNQSFDDMSFAFKLNKAPGHPSFVVFGNYDEVMQEGFEQTGISHEEVLFAPVVDLFRVPNMQAPQAGWWLVEVTAKVHGHPSNLLKLRAEFFTLSALNLAILLSCILFCRWCKGYWKGERPRYPCFSGTCSFCGLICCWLGIFELLMGLYYISTAGVFEPALVYAALDTGTSLLSVPVEYFEPLALAMLGDDYWFSCAVQGGSLICLCDLKDKVRPLGFEIGGKDFWLRPSEMFFYVGDTPDGKAICMTGLSGNPQPIWILGDVFLRQAFVVHSYNRREVALFPYVPGPPTEVHLFEGVPTGVLPHGAWLLALAIAVALLTNRVALRSQRNSNQEPLLKPQEVPGDLMSTDTNHAAGC